MKGNERMKLPRPADSSADFVVIDAGIYKMRLDRYEGPTLSQFKKKDGSDQYQVKLFFIIDEEDEDFGGETISEYYGLSMHPTMSKLYPIVKALLGREPEEDEELDIEDLKGREIMGTVDNVKKTKDGQERTYANLIAASPVKKKKVKPAPAPVPPPVAEEDDIDWQDEDEDAA